MKIVAIRRRVIPDKTEFLQILEKIKEEHQMAKSKKQ